MTASIVIKLLERVAVLEAQVKSLIAYQKWQLGLLGAILVAVISAWMAR